MSKCILHIIQAVLDMDLRAQEPLYYIGSCHLNLGSF